MSAFRLDVAVAGCVQSQSADALSHDNIIYCVTARLQATVNYNCLSNAMHGQNINLPVSVCLCVRHTFCQLAYRSDPQWIFTVDSLKDADLCKDVPFGGIGVE